jgi:hypothetical protein
MTHHEQQTNPSCSVNETADYIATLSKELAVMARGQRLDFLAYLLEMAATEALKQIPLTQPVAMPRKIRAKKPLEIRKLS